jgi:phage/plasmid primase-like uncharacterized protein
MTSTDSFRAAMRERGIAYDGFIAPDGKLHRFKAEGDSDASSWYVLHDDGKFMAGAFGCWRRSIKENWNSANGDQLTADEKRLMSQRWRESDNARKTDEEKRQTEAKIKAQSLLSAAVSVTENLYLQRKHVGAHGEIRSDHQGVLLLPLRDINGLLQSLQFIAPDKRFHDGRDKDFLPGGKVQGCFYEVCSRPDGPLVICEGYSTGASIHEATGWAVVCAMSCGNLAAVAKGFREKSADRTIIIAGDDDRFGKTNAGREEATKAAAAVKGMAVFPEFSDTDTQSTDFNDLAKLGPELVRLQIMSSLANSSDWSLLVREATDTMKETVPDPVELIAGLVTECSKCVIGGSSKSFKTWFSLDAAICLASGLPFLNRATNPIPVMYVNLELKERTLKKRIKTIVEAKQAAGFLVNLSNFRHVTLRGKLAGLSVHEVVNRLLKLVSSINAKALFLDPIYKLNTEGDENSSRDQTKLFNELDRITTEGRATLILNDHFSKGSQSDKDPLDAIRGSSAKGGDVDAAIIIRAHETQFSYTVDVIHRELPPVEPFVISWKYPLFSLDEALDPAALKQPRRGRQATFDPLAAIAAISDSSSSNPYSRNAWAKKAGINSSTLLNHLPSLRKKGWIFTVGEGTFAKHAISPKGLEILASSNSET